MLCLRLGVFLAFVSTSLAAFSLALAGVHLLSPPGVWASPGIGRPEVEGGTRAPDTATCLGLAAQSRHLRPLWPFDDF